jgi:hypothetical protein
VRIRFRDNEKTILKCLLICFLVDRSGVADPFLIMFFQQTANCEKYGERYVPFKKFFGSTVADPHPKKRAVAPYFN